MTSQIGTQISALAVPLLILGKTHSAALAGVVSAVSMLPYLFGPIAGVLSDRWDRKRVLALTDVGRTVALGSIAVAIWLGRLTIPQIFVAVVAERALATLYSSARMASIPQIVARDELRVAAAMDRFSAEASALSGGPLGGLLYGAGHALPFVADAATYALRIVSLAFVHEPLQPETTSRRRNLLADLVEGLAWFWRQPVIRATSLALAAYNPVYVASTLLLILLARRLGASPPEIGLVFALRAAGGLIGSALAPRVVRLVELGPLFVVTLFVASLVFLGLAAADSPVVLGLLAGGLVTIDAAALVGVVGFRLALVPPELQGRVNSVFVSVETAALPLGALAVGTVSQAWGPRAAALSCAAWMLIVTIAALAYPSLRSARHLTS